MDTDATGKLGYFTKTGSEVFTIDSSGNVTFNGSLTASGGSIIFTGSTGPTATQFGVGSDGTNLEFNVPTGGAFDFDINAVNAVSFDASSGYTFNKAGTSTLRMTILTPSGNQALQLGNSTQAGGIFQIFGDATGNNSKSVVFDMSANIAHHIAITAQGMLFNDISNGSTIMDFEQGARPVFNYGNQPTAGIGIVPIRATAGPTSSGVVQTNFLNFSPPATAGTYRINVLVDISVSTTHSFSANLVYTDNLGTSRTVVMSGFSPIGTAIAAGLMTNAIGAGTYSLVPLTFSIDNSATAITLSTVGTFTTVTYTLTVVLEQLI